ncbi:LPS O-antigen length regulator [Colwellia sp. E2M01]|nr:LPS O-antigen length regulator [Colwellia sp. E2M01]
MENPQVSTNDEKSKILQQQLFQQQLQNSYNNSNQDDEIDIAELWHAIWAGKFIIIFISLLFAVASVFFALSQPNIYKASVILTPAESEGGAGGLAALAGQFGGLASMAGINLGGGGGADKSGLAIEVLQSRSFIESFIERHNLLVPLMASKGWDINSNKLLFNEQVYDQSNKKWIREFEAPRTAEPSPWEAFQEFSELLSIEKDKSTSMITINISFYSPDIAKKWLTLLVHDINEFMREQDKEEAQTSIDYLKDQLANIKIATMEKVFYQLIEEQTKSMMLIMVKKEYVLKTIDPAQVPDIKDKPKRALIVVLGTILGGVLSVLIVLFRYFMRREQ